MKYIKISTIHQSTPNGDTTLFLPVDPHHAIAVTAASGEDKKLRRDIESVVHTFVGCYASDEKPEQIVAKIEDALKEDLLS